MLPSTTRQAQPLASSLLMIEKQPPLTLASLGASDIVVQGAARKHGAEGGPGSVVTGIPGSPCRRRALYEATHGARRGAQDRLDVSTSLELLSARREAVEARAVGP